MSQKSHRHEFATLDVLRGIAALAVVQYHLYMDFGRVLFPHGHLAVDFFFMLSGFVITHAYQNRLQDGWTTLSFLKVRLIRLYPLYILGTALGCTLYLLDARTPGTHSRHPTIALVALLGILLLPTPGGLIRNNTNLFPFNYPAWSLFYELLANFYHAIVLRKQSVTRVIVWLVTSGLVFVISALYFDTVNIGPQWSMLLFGLSRAIFGYTVGIAIYRIHARTQSTSNLGIAGAAILLLLTLALPTPARWTTLYELTAVLVVFPPLLFFSARSAVPQWLLPTAKLLGSGSYAIYVLHAPLASVFERMWAHLFHHTLTQDAPISGCAYIVWLFLLSIFLDRIYDRKIRGFLRRRLQSSYS